MLLKKSSITTLLNETSKGTTDEPSKWLPASIAPADELLEVCVIDNKGDVQPFVFPSFKNEIEWVCPLSGRRLDIQPTHWRKLSPPHWEKFSPRR